MVPKGGIFLCSQILCLALPRRPRSFDRPLLLSSLEAALPVHPPPHSPHTLATGELGRRVNTFWGSNLLRVSCHCGQRQKVAVVVVLWLFFLLLFLFFLLFLFLCKAKHTEMIFNTRIDSSDLLHCWPSWDPNGLFLKYHFLPFWND